MLKDDGVDPHGGRFYSRYERVRVERVWKEALNKEREIRREGQKQNGAPSYVMNLANTNAKGNLLNLKHSHCRLEIIADKVEKQAPKDRMSLEGFDPNSFEVVAMKHVEKTPTQKWDLPCSTSQEIGWLMSHPSRAKAIRERQQSKAYPVETTTVPGESSALHSRSAPQLSPHIPRGEPIRELRLLNNKKLYKPRTFCPITRYADTYVSLMHQDPFSQSANR